MDSVNYTVCIKDIKQVAGSRTPRIHGCFINGTLSSKPFPILLDTGSSYSCISKEFYQNLYENDLATSLTATVRAHPTVANASTMMVLGDCIMTVRFNNEDRYLECQNIRFSVFQQLAMPVILGIEALKILEFKVVSDRVYLNNFSFNILEDHVYSVDFVINDAILFDDNCRPKTIASMVVNPADKDLLQFIPKGDYLFTPLFSQPDIISSKPYQGQNDFDVVLVNSTELQDKIDYHFNMELYQLPNTVRVRLESVDRERNKRVEDCNFTSRVLNIKNRARFIDDNVVQKLANNSDFDKNGKNKLAELIRQHRYVFSIDEDDVGKFTDETVKIELKNPNSEPVYIKPRRVAYALRGWLENKLKTMVDQGIIQESRGSEYNSPLHLVKKKNGRYRIVCDQRGLNAKIRGNTYPLPNLFELLDRLQGSNFFTSIDFRSGFYHLVLHPDSRKYTAFSANSKQYEWLRLPMGLRISPSCFQRIMMRICGDLLNSSCQIYLDDLLVYSKTQNDHLRTLQTVFERFGRAGMLLNPEKCEFARTELNYVGYTINQKGWKPQQRNIDAVKNFPTPTNKTAARSFSGMCTFYTAAVPCLQYVLGPIHSITGTKSEFKWENAQQEAFLEAKSLLVNNAIISFPSLNPKHIIYLTTDASDLGWSAILSQVLDDSIERPLGFSSGRFRNSQNNWTIKNKELYAFIKGLQIYHVHLYLRPFRWRTDNRSLSYLTAESVVKKDPQKLQQKILRWLDYISMYTFEIEHHKGDQSCMKVADALSRHFHTNVMAVNSTPVNKIKTPFWCETSITIGELLQAQDDDTHLKNESREWKTFSQKGWVRVTKEKVIYYRKKSSEKLRMAIPQKFQKKLIEFHHLPTHLGTVKLYLQLKKKFVFPKMFDKIRQHISSCDLCVAFKCRKKPKVIPTVTSTGIHPFAFIICDLMGPLSQTLRGNRYILVTICVLTRWIELRPLEDKSAETVAHALVDIFLCRGFPLSLQTDQGSEFKNKALTTLLKNSGIRLHHGTAYRPQSQGLCERANRNISAAMKLIRSEAITWDDDLRSISMSLNLQHHASLGTSPWMCVHGWVFQRPCFIPPKFAASFGEKEKWSISNSL